MSAIRITGEGGTATMLASSYDTHSPAVKGTITLVSVGGGYALKQFDTGVGGTFDFALRSPRSTPTRQRWYTRATLNLPAK